MVQKKPQLSSGASPIRRGVHIFDDVVRTLLVSPGSNPLNPVPELIPPPLFIQHRFQIAISPCEILVSRFQVLIRLVRPQTSDVLQAQFESGGAETFPEIRLLSRDTLEKSVELGKVQRNRFRFPVRLRNTPCFQVDQPPEIPE